MKKFILILSLCLSVSAFAEDLCPLAVGKNWKGWVKVQVFKVNGTAKVMHLAGSDYLVEASIPDLGIHETYQGTCKDSRVTGKDLKGNVMLQRSGNTLFVDHAQDGGTAHFERSLNGLSFWQLLGLE